MTPVSLKAKHVNALVATWQSQEIATGTFKNRVTALRWWASKIHKQNVIAKENIHYGIQPREYVTKVSRGQAVDRTRIPLIKDNYVRLSVRLQAAFGLRSTFSV